MTASADAGGVVLAVGSALSACGLAGAPFAGELLRRLPRRTPVFFARWGFSHALQVALVGCAAGIVLGPLVHALAGPADVEGGSDVLPALYLSMAMLAAAAAAAALFARRLHPEGLRALGLERSGNVRALGAGALAYVLVLPLIVGVAVLWPLCAGALGFEPEPQTVLVGIEGLSGPALWQAVVLAVVVGPLLEETLFRGFLQPLLVQNLRERGGIAVTSVLFAALHGASAFAPVFVLSLLLGYVQLRTHRLAGPWFVHGLHNAATLFVVLALPEWYASLES